MIIKTVGRTDSLCRKSHARKPTFDRGRGCNESVRHLGRFCSLQRAACAGARRLCRADRSTEPGWQAAGKEPRSDAALRACRARRRLLGRLQYLVELEWA